jgi:hypothetical protein
MRSAKKLTTLSVALVVVLAAAAAAVAAGNSGAAKPDKLTGYPSKINQVDLSGYQIQTSYPLGKLDAGSTYLQKYSGNSVTATAIAGPYVGSPASHFKYIAVPVTHDILLLVWLEPKFKHNTFVYNFKTHLSSVVTWDQKGDPSLGSVTIVKKGAHPIP